MALSVIEIYNGLFCLIFVIISSIVSIKLILKYFTYKNRTFLLVGFTWIGLSESWWPPSIALLSVLATGEALAPEFYFLIGNILVPFSLLAWLTAFTDLVYKEKQKIILLIFAIIGILYEILFFYFLFNDISMIGETFGYIDARYNWFRMAYVLFILIVAVLTGILFARESIKSENPEIRMKGKLIIAAVISFLIGAALDGLFVIDVVSLIIYKLILISSAIEFYFGFFLPDWIKKRLHS